MEPAGSDPPLLKMALEGKDVSPYVEHLEVGFRPKSGSSRATLDKHFAIGSKISQHYRRRNDNPHELELAIRACEDQIAMAATAAKAFIAEEKKFHRDARRFGSDTKGLELNLPSHEGYRQLAIIREKRGQYSEAIELCEQAKAQGWAGDWDDRIKRNQKKAKRK